uniref:Putative von Willebrand factor A domain-containing protein n=1 Tax=viral metagenome TaxID=1070528 RepID=A0A6M3LBR2_9ZZZZ
MNVINIDSYDKISFKEVKEEAPNLQKMEEIGKTILPTFPDLMQDVYGSLYKYDPKLVDGVDDPLARNIMEQVMASREWKEMREFTRLQNFESAVGVQAFSESLTKSIPSEVKEKSKTIGKVNEEMEQALNEDPANNIKIKSLAQSQAALQKEMRDLLEKNKDEMRRVVRKSLQKANQEVQEVQAMVSGFGSEPGQPCNLPMESKIRLAQRLKGNPKLKRIADIAGRFQRMALHYQATKTQHGVDEVVDVECGNDLSRVLSSEYATMNDPDLGVLFLKKYAESKLLQFKLEGKEQEARGPIIVCIDNSGSMAGSREEWAKGFSLGLLTIARKQKREFAIVHFSNKSTIKTFHFPDPKKAGQAELIDALSLFLGGGTDFMTPMNEAHRIITSSKTMKKADVVFVSDGDCRMEEENQKRVKEWKKELGFKVIGVMVETNEKLPFEHDSEIHLWGQDDQAILKETYGKI